MLIRSMLGRKRASQGPILSFSGIKRQRTADPVKNVSVLSVECTNVYTVCVLSRTGQTDSVGCGRASQGTSF